MKILGGLSIVGGIVLSAGLYYLTKVDIHSNVDLSFQLIEQQTALGFPLWIAGLPLIIIGAFLLSKRPPSPVTATVLNQSTPNPVFTPPEEPIQDGGTLSVDNVDESAFLADWRVMMNAEIKGILLPSGASIVDTPTQGVQLGLVLNRTTPQATKQALHAFAEVLHKIPTPPRVRIELLDVMATGVPIKNMAMGGFGKFFAKQDFIITEQIDGLDIRFNRPNECWE